ncbi:MAG: PIG-L family deacetylase [Patescibacteria group bacterium]|nr:PIG-L family deacetylase [Patescibacteria group bacterium]
MHNRDNLFLEKIMRRECPCYFVSPHLDDAALSAGGLISCLAGKVKLKIITVFTKASAAPYTLSIKKFLNMCGYADAEKFYCSRTAEDARAWSGLGVEFAHLGFIDALWRRKRRQSLFAKFIPEWQYLYPTYRFHVISGKIAEEDFVLKTNITKALEKALSAAGSATIFCPAGFGGHVDHILAREACKDLVSQREAEDKNSEEKFLKVIAVNPSTKTGEPSRKVIFWKDFPYRAGKKETRRFKDCFKGYKEWRWGGGFGKKQELASSYKSQVPQMFPEGRLPEVPEVYYSA